jgi:hypothetical protein
MPSQERSHLVHQRTRATMLPATRSGTRGAGAHKEFHAKTNTHTRKRLKPLHQSYPSQCTKPRPVTLAASSVNTRATTGAGAGSAARALSVARGKRARARHEKGHLGDAEGWHSNRQRKRQAGKGGGGEGGRKGRGKHHTHTHRHTGRRPAVRTCGCHCERGHAERLRRVGCQLMSGVHYAEHLHADAPKQHAKKGSCHARVNKADGVGQRSGQPEVRKGRLPGRCGISTAPAAACPASMQCQTPAPRFPAACRLMTPT